MGDYRMSAKDRADHGSQPNTLRAGRRRNWRKARFVGPTLLAALLFCLPLAGCGGGSDGNTAHWSGTVTIGGQPLPADAEGSITFRPTSREGKPVSVPIENGRYDSPNTPKGQVIALFSIQRPTGRTYHSDRTGEDVAETEDIVPVKHGQGMKLDVQGDDSEANLEL